VHGIAFTALAASRRFKSNGTQSGALPPTHNGLVIAAAATAEIEREKRESSKRNINGNAALIISLLSTFALLSAGQKQERKIMYIKPACQGKHTAGMERDAPLTHSILSLRSI
jgi:hypothetical protein